MWQPPYLKELGLGDARSTFALMKQFNLDIAHIDQTQPKAMLCSGRADFKKDLHNFAFLGKTARIGTASDWVWYNVPHGPQKQIESFICGQKCIRVGKEEVCWCCTTLPFSRSLM